MTSREFRANDTYLRSQNLLWPEFLKPVPKSDLPPSFGQQDIAPVRVFRSCKFLVQEFAEKDGAVRLSINRAAILSDGRWRDGITWDEINLLKAECGYAHRWAVEIFPPAEEVVNVANIRHIFVVKDAPMFAWKKAVRDDAKGTKA